MFAVKLVDAVINNKIPGPTRILALSNAHFFSHFFFFL